MKIGKYRKKLDFPLLILKISLIMAVISLGITYYMKSLKPMILSALARQACQVISLSTEQAVLSYLDSHEIGYSSFVTVLRDANGKITGIETDSAQVNRFKAEIGRDILTRIGNFREQDMQIAIGSLSDIPFFWGKGFKLSIKVQPIGSLQTELISEFSSAGINQTRHQIQLRVVSCVEAIVPGNRTPVEVISNYVIAETIIVGETPSFFAGFLS